MKLLFLPTLFVLATSACLDGESEIGGLCYTFVDRQLSFEDAKDYCHSFNTNLAYVPSSTTSNFLASYARIAFGMNYGDFWIGLSKDSTWKWDNGAPVVFTNFGVNNGKNYAAEDVTNGKWNTFRAEDLKKFVCSYDPNAQPTSGPTASTKLTTNPMTSTKSTTDPMTSTKPTTSPLTSTKPTTRPTKSTTTMNIITKTVTRKDAQCSPESPRTFLFAYSTDFDYSLLNDTFQDIADKFKYEAIWTTYANVRFDMKYADKIEYHYSTSTFNASLYSHLPDSSLGYKDSRTGSDVFNVIKNFLKTSPTLCGSSILIAVKRYPNEVEDLNTMIDELRKNHIFIHIVASDTPSGGNNPSALFTVSSRTNGLCSFCKDFFMDVDTHLASTTIVLYPFQVASKNVLVSGKGSQDLSFRVYNSRSGTQYLPMYITYLTHKVDDSVKAFDYNLKDPNGKINTSGSPYLSVRDTMCSEGSYVNDTMEYTLTVNYDYKTSRQETIEMRFYSFYKIDHWLPFDN